MNNFASILLAGSLTVALAACGTKGPLELPPGPAPEPIFGNAKPAKPTPKNTGSADVSTDQKARPQ